MGRGNQGSLQKGHGSTTEGGYFASSKVCRDIPMGRAMPLSCREDVRNDQGLVLFKFVELFFILVFFWLSLFVNVCGDVSDALVSLSLP